MKRNFPHFNRVCSPDALRVLPGPRLYRVRRPVRLGSFSWVTQGPDAQGGRSLQGAVPLVREGVRAKIPSLWLCCCSPQDPPSRPPLAALQVHGKFWLRGALRAAAPTGREACGTR